MPTFLIVVNLCPSFPLFDCTLHIHTRSRTHTHTHTHTHTYTHTHTHTHAHTCTLAHMRTCAHTHSKIPKDIFSYTCKNCAVSDVLPFHDVSFEEPVNTRNDSINMSELNVDKDMWLPFKKRGLHFLHININSILSK